MRTRRAALFLAVALAIVALPGRAGAEQNVTIDATEFRLTPMALNVAAGDVVHFTVRNVGTVRHNLEVELESAGVEQKLFPTDLQPGETRTVDFTFSRPGTWEMYCPVGNHKERGMTGSIAVAAGGGAPPAPAPPVAAPPPAGLPAPAPAQVPSAR